MNEPDIKTENYLVIRSIYGTSDPCVWIFDIGNLDEELLVSELHGKDCESFVLRLEDIIGEPPNICITLKRAQEDTFKQIDMLCAITQLGALHERRKPDLADSTSPTRRTMHRIRTACRQAMETCFPERRKQSIQDRLRNEW